MQDLIIQSNFACILICVFLIIFSLTDRSFERKVRNLFFISIFAVLILCITDSVQYIAASGTKPSLLRSITSATGYAFRPLTVYSMALIIKRNDNKIIKWYGIPFAVNAFFAYASIFTGCIFWFDDMNAFHRGVLSPLPYIVGGFYMLLMIHLNVQEFHKKNVSSEMVLVFVIVLISSVAVSLETVYEYKYILNSSIAVSLIFYYLYLYIQLYKRDALTNLLNRRSFYLDANDNKNKDMMIISLDMNNLKKINDEQGHAAGDKAILTIVNAIEDSLVSGCRLYRVGGDEFMIFYKNGTYNQTVAMIDNIKKKLESTDYSIAAGYALYSGDNRFDEVCSKSDEMMYEDKRLSKQGRCAEQVN